eukprot:TRINITY_DN17024_c1_g1_i1.p1 TRINITY_DN17024_c1_g1~~TRINITY_DN17024_c1_g1_i1.p1  ORF type:complete len:458 (+),score=68.82 TRINITY_DN17024_c1_g1_i1:61-1434(+)
MAADAPQAADDAGTLSSGFSEYFEASHALPPWTGPSLPSRLPMYVPLERPSFDPFGPLAGYDLGLASAEGPIWSRLRSSIYPVLDLCIDAYYVALSRTFQGELEFMHHADSVEQLVREGADVEVRDDISGGSPLHFAAGSGSVEICQALLWSRARVCARDARLQTPLWWAIAGDHVEVCRLLLAKEEGLALLANIEQLTPLHESARLGQARLVSLLLPAYTGHFPGRSGRSGRVRPGPDVRGGKSLRTPLHLACIHRHLETCVLLLSARADPQVKCSSGRTALHHACAGARGFGAAEGEGKLLDLCHLLLRPRPRIQKLRDASGRTPAELAALGGHLAPDLELLLSMKPAWRDELPMGARQINISSLRAEQRCASTGKASRLQDRTGKKDSKGQGPCSRSRSRPEDYSRETLNERLESLQQRLTDQLQTVECKRLSLEAQLNIFRPQLRLGPTRPST